MTKASDDTISRQKAISESKKLYAMGDCYCDEYSMVGMLNSLPPAQPVTRGTWIENIYCSECGWVNEVESGFIGNVEKFNYCPNCGAKMVAE